ncbi:hypothetical protein [uncultured Enterovirga sp.]|uniref:hypothetical protein n=1 Tax=uncultured Enterovirga sp. TaxID=2026352 RepID=UPI0035CC6766
MFALRPVLLASLLYGATAVGASAQDQEAVGFGSLRPIERGYGARIATWAKGFFVEPAALRGLSISDPILIRDGTGRLLWLVCLEARNPLTTPPPARTERHAFGFAPDYFTAPQERRGSSLTFQTCDEQPLVWRAFRDTTRRSR